MFAAAVTPLDASGAPDLAALPGLIDFLAGRGCHGVLLLGTTGEGPSFSVRERIEVVREGLRHRGQAWPKLQILAGTGCANLADTIELTRAAFDLGVDAVVTLPAFYYKGVGPDGITSYFEQVVRSAVPADGRLLAYHIPQVSSVAIPAASLHALRQQFPDQVWGMKDSQDDLAHTLETTREFPGFHVFCRQRFDLDRSPGRRRQRLDYGAGQCDLAAQPGRVGRPPERQRRARGPASAGPRPAGGQRA